MARLRRFHWSRSWYIVWSEDRRSQRISTFTEDRQDAERQLAEFEVQRHAPPREFTTNDLIHGYLDSLSGRRWHSNRVYEMSAVRLHFGAVHPSIVSSVLVRSFISKRTSEGVARSTIDRQLRAFRACLSWGIKNGWKFDIPYIETPGGSPPRQRWLTHDEADRLIACCEEPHVRLFVLVALHSGARTCAILDLTWDRVDLDRNLLLYPPHRPGSRKRTTVVPINQTLVSALEEARECALTDWVIEYRGRPIQSVKTGFRAAVRRAGLDHCTPHDLRRTCATWLVQAGLPLSKVARYLGDSEEMIEKVYGQHSPDFLRDAARSLER